MVSFTQDESHETLIVRAKDFFDNATPSGNSVAAETLCAPAPLITVTTKDGRRLYFV